MHVTLGVEAVIDQLTFVDIAPGALLRAGEGGPAAANILANVLLAIGAVWVGRLVAQTVVSG